jgi:molybdopterin/thiamine biosynthesis adenylyltransferase
MDDRFSRQSFLGENSNRILRESRVAIVGLGGGGSHVAQQLAHIGVGDIMLFDPDRVEDSNINRLVGATWDDVVQKTLKAETARRLISGVNPDAKVTCVEEVWQSRAALLRDRDVIFGCVDTLAGRRDLEAAARRYLTPYIDIGMDVHPVEGYFAISGQATLSMPGRPCLRCMGILRDDLLDQEARNYGAAGGKSQVIWPNGILASIAVGIFIQLVTPWHKKHLDCVYFEYDGNIQSVSESKRLMYMKNIICPHFRGFGEVGDPFWGKDFEIAESARVDR